jgi:hypothetical protein
MSNEHVTIDIRGKTTTIDKCDLPIFNAHSWWFTRGYLVTKIKTDSGHRRCIGIHRLILGDPLGLEVDHIDRNPSNNTRANLRAVSKSVNLKNTKTRSNKKSSFRGVSRNEKRRKWEVVVRINGKLKWLGYFDNEAEAGSVAAPYFLGVAP